MARHRDLASRARRCARCGIGGDRPLPGARGARPRPRPRRRQRGVTCASHIRQSRRGR